MNLVQKTLSPLLVGRSNMKVISFLIPVLVIATLSFVSTAKAKDKTPEVNEKSVYAKCFVELVGGSETISFWPVKPSALKGVTQNIVGKEILLVKGAQKAGSNKKATIYKVKQCILEEEKFRSSRARAMDKEYER